MKTFVLVFYISCGSQLFPKWPVEPLVSLNVNALNILVYVLIIPMWHSVRPFISKRPKDETRLCTIDLDRIHLNS